MSKDAKFVVRLTEEERTELQAMVDEGRGAKTVRQRARGLLKADESQAGPAWTDERVAEFAEVSVRTVERVRKRFVEEGSTRPCSASRRRIGCIASGMGPEKRASSPKRAASPRKDAVVGR